MDPTSLETVSRWASAAAVVLSALAAIAITIAAYASSRVLTVTNARAAQVRAESARAVVAVDATATEAEAHSRAAPAVAGELKSDDRPPQAELTRTTGSKPESAESPVATTGQAMIAVLHADYIRTARAKGVANHSMLLKHALKNAGVPIITVIGIGVALLIGGVVITETVFNIPGVGRLVVDAISKRDYPIIQGVILIFSGVYVLVNLAVDLTYTLLDPRIRY